MNAILWVRWMFCVSFVFSLIACGDANSEYSSAELATVVFFNHSSFDVRIYRNFNPEQDPAAYIGTAVRNSPGLTLRLAPSGTGEVGCTFFLRYQLPIQESIIPGVNNQGVMAGAAPNWDNIPIVIRSNETYNIQINQPTAADLRFFTGYIAVQNINNNRVWLERGNSPLYREDNGALWLNPGDIGFYKITIPPGQESIFADMFHARNEQAISAMIEPFNLHQGILYWFEFDQTGIILTRTRDILDFL